MTNVEFWTDDRGFSKIRDPESGAIVPVHYLTALCTHSVEEIARDDVVVHHEIGDGEAGVKVDVPGAVVPLTRSVHRRLHADDDATVAPDRVLGPERPM